MKRLHPVEAFLTVVLCLDENSFCTQQMHRPSLAVVVMAPVGAWWRGASADVGLLWFLWVPADGMMEWWQLAEDASGSCGAVGSVDGRKEGENRATGRHS